MKYQFETNSVIWSCNDCPLKTVNDDYEVLCSLTMERIDGDNDDKLDSCKLSLINESED